MIIKPVLIMLSRKIHTPIKIRLGILIKEKMAMMSCLNPIELKETKKRTQELGEIDGLEEWKQDP